MHVHVPPHVHLPRLHLRLTALALCTHAHPAATAHPPPPRTCIHRHAPASASPTARPHPSHCATIVFASRILVPAPAAKHLPLVKHPQRRARTLCTSMHSPQDPAPCRLLDGASAHISAPASHTLCAPEAFTQAQNCPVFPYRHSLARPQICTPAAALYDTPACTALRTCLPLTHQSPACSTCLLHYTVHCRISHTMLYTHTLPFLCVAPRVVRHTSMPAHTSACTPQRVHPLIGHDLFWSIFDFLLSPSEPIHSHHSHLFIHINVGQVLPQSSPPAVQPNACGISKDFFPSRAQLREAHLIWAVSRQPKHEEFRAQGVTGSGVYGCNRDCGLIAYHINATVEIEVPPKLVSPGTLS
ncbi:hypothetical protein B0H14DRAFT_3460104 [Mycena olivaceomarginata]|nr:hypothetical protein B0H14DRAFT_3460104 [Mycena olivaceomarginata]